VNQHSHDWKPIDPEALSAGWACTECPATAYPCGDCGERLDTTGRTCDRCVSRARNDIRDVRDLYRELPDVIAAIAGLHAVRYDERGSKRRTANDTTIVGGAALVMAGDGNLGTSRLGKYESPTDRTVREVLSAQRDDPPSVLAVLTSWEDAWRVEQHQHAADKTTVDAAVDYLLQHVTWAAQHSETWSDHRVDTRQLRSRLRMLTGATAPPKPSDAPCIECNGTIVQRYTADGLDDIRECNSCGATYSPVRYMLAVNERLETVRNDPDRLLTAAEARTLWHLSEKQIYVWEQRTDDAGKPKIASVGRDSQGRKLYRNSDIAALRRARTP
jgi:hypothetical protein